MSCRSGFLVRNCFSFITLWRFFPTSIITDSFADIALWASNYHLSELKLHCSKPSWLLNFSWDSCCHSDGLAFLSDMELLSLFSQYAFFPLYSVANYTGRDASPGHVCLLWMPPVSGLAFFFLIWGIFWYNFIQTIFSALERNFLLCLCSWVLLSWIFYISYSYLFTVSFVLGLFDFFHFVSNSDSLSPPWSILFVSLSIEIFLWLIVTFISNSSWLFLFSFYVFNSSSI